MVHWTDHNTRNLLSMDILRGFLGITLLLAICFAMSSNRRKIDWQLVVVALLLQFALAVLLLKVPVINAAFDSIAYFFTTLLSYSLAGSEFIFGTLVEDTETFGIIFAFQILPTIVFFSAFSAILYYFGILQKVIQGMAWFMKRTMRLSGGESLAAAANVFIGQTEAPLVVKPYLEKFSRSELMCLMTGGMATIAGGVFAAYIQMLGGDDPVQKTYFAKHLLTASIISAPAAILAAKMLVPETEEKSIERQLEMSEDTGTNLLDAISRGTTDGVKLAVNVGAMLLVFTALVYMANQLLLYPGEWFGLNEKIKVATEGRYEGLTFTYLLGLIFAPLAWVLGTPSADLLVMGQLLGTKTVINEFVAYSEMETIRNTGKLTDPKSILIATYALCGFANFASIGIQIGGIGAIAPGQRQALTQLGIKALIGGTVACFMTAAIAGMLF